MASPRVKATAPWSRRAWGSEGATWTGRLERVRSIKAQAHLLQQWALFRKLYTRADELAARFAVDQVLDGSLPPEQAHEAFDLAVNEFYGYEILRTFRELETFTHESRQHLSESFRSTDRELLKNDDEDEDDGDEETAGRGVAQDAESILECAKNAFPPPQRLLWHYRSQHESLIRFSNYAYYDEELIVFPAASDDSGRLGIKFHHLPEGRYKSGARVNETEAGIVARAALDHLMANPSETLLVATFNRPQQELIDALVEKYASEDEAVLERLEEARQHPKEPFAVKNLENVQGDERDVIYVSCTYGPDLNTGIVMQRFGPVAGAGGRRRLNVLFTRAKQRLEVFSSMTHEQIIERPGEDNGVNDLRKYLRFAQTGILADSGKRTGQAPDSYFEEAVMRVVESAGFRAVPQVGVSSYRIDIGVEHPSRPGEFILGIECDGAMYHSAKTARDRDRLRQEVLERRGWKIHRIWSTDWFRQNQVARKRLLDTLHTLQ